MLVNFLVYKYNWLARVFIVKLTLEKYNIKNYFWLPVIKINHFI